MTTLQQHISKHKVRRAFDRAANSYDAAAVLQKEVCRRLLDKLDYIRLSPQLVLDAGVGTGEAVAPLMRRYKKSRLVALDLSEHMLRACGERLAREPEAVQARARLVRADMRDFDLGRTFPLVIIPFQSLQELTDSCDVTAALRGMH